MLELIKELWVFIRTDNPYPDSTSFCGWLRVFLAAADPSRKWVAINAVGISYASSGSGADGRTGPVPA